jgi:RNA polymerase sigma factor (sigma-70 family)
VKMITPSTALFPACWCAEKMKPAEIRRIPSPVPRQRTAGASQEPKPASSDKVGEHSASNDAYLIAECLNGNEKAWEALIQKYKRLVYSIPIKYGASPADAEDILQSVYMQLFCELSKLRRAESLKSWLMVVTSRKCFQWHRRKRNEMTLDDIEEQHPEAIAISPPETLEAQEEQCLREAIAQLSPRCRELVRLLFYEQPPMPYAEVARRLGLSTGSIGFTRGSCLVRLQKILLKMGF